MFHGRGSGGPKQRQWKKRASAAFAGFFGKRSAGNMPAETSAAPQKQAESQDDAAVSDADGDACDDMPGVIFDSDYDEPECVVCATESDRTHPPHGGSRPYTLWTWGLGPQILNWSYATT